MKAVEFVKKFGWEIAKIATDTVKDDDYLLRDLKTLVEAKELVDGCGGLSEAKLKSEIPMCFGDNDFFQEVTLKQAIKLVESVER